MSRKPDKAFLLAAGKGTRLRPYTDTVPKPMVDIAGQSIIERAMEKLAQDGVKDVVVNLHHLAPVLEAHLAQIDKPRIILSPEDDLLETGGGVKKALSHFNGQPFYILNGDALWDDGERSALSRLAQAWDESKMDILLFLQPKALMSAHAFVGDYHLLPDGRAQRAKDKSGNYMFAGIRIVHPRIFDGSPDGAFSFLTLMDKAEEQSRLYAVAHDSAWYHISTPEDLEEVGQLFLERQNR